MNSFASPSQLVLNYIRAFNSRDERSMRSSFSPSLVTIHPDDPSLDVSSSEPFITRMMSLWDKDFCYDLRDLNESRSLIHSSSSSIVFAEFSIGILGFPPVATELVRYKCTQFIDEFTVYKIFNPKHPDYKKKKKISSYFSRKRLETLEFSLLYILDLYLGIDPAD